MTSFISGSFHFLVAVEEDYSVTNDRVLCLEINSEWVAHDDVIKS